MIPLILGLGSAALFLGLTLAVYGVQILGESPWVTMVFLGLVGSGLGVYLLSRPMPAWLCRLQERIGLVDDLCDTQGSCR